jgi:flagellin
LFAYLPYKLGRFLIFLENVMAMVITTNAASINAQRHLNTSRQDLEVAMERLSSGQRINSAADDSAGLAIRDKMTSQIQGLNQSVRNANDAISFMQTAEGALEETTNILHRMRTIAVQAVNDTNSSSDRTSLNDEISKLQAEISRIASTTTFNDKNLIDGSMTDSQFQIGHKSGQQISVALNNMSATAIGTGSGVTTAVGSVAVTSVSLAAAGISSIDNALAAIGTERAKLGAFQNRLQHAVNNMTNMSANTSAARSQVADADYASESSSLAKNQILQQAGTAMLAQANASAQSVLSLLK